jgi:Pentapeptide repeats (8 copies)
MTRTPHLNLNLQNITRRIRDGLPDRLRPAGLSRKNAAYVAAGLALASAAGATAAVGFSSQPAGITAARDSVDGIGRAHIVKRPAAATKHGGANNRPANNRAANNRPANNRPAEHGATNHGAANHGAANHGAANHGAANHGAAKNVAAKHAAGGQSHQTWPDVMRIVANRTVPQPGHGQLPPRDRLTPVGTSGPQMWMPITPVRYENAKTIVAQAIDEHMGLRSAVIAVATAMQESTLLNLPYGDQDSVGLFQQRPSSGWGTASQIQQPAYAASAFLGALRGYQAQNPGWASQPLWQPAQGVQQSAFPAAYAKWEAQAAQLVASVTKHLI